MDFCTLDIFWGAGKRRRLDMLLCLWKTVDITKLRHPSSLLDSPIAGFSAVHSKRGGDDGNVMA